MPALDLTKRYTVVGLGVTGRSVVRFLRARGATVFAVDEQANADVAASVELEFPGLGCSVGPTDASCLDHTDVLVPSPGVPRDADLVAAARERGLEIVGDIELFARVVDRPVIAVTGTNGKITVVSMVDACGAVSHLRVATGGNLGMPALDLLADGVDVYLLELSSYQLETTSSLAPFAAAVLNVTPDHLDRYPGGLDEYAAAKARIFRGAQHCLAPLGDVLALPRELNDGQQLTTVAVEGEGADVAVIERAGSQWIAVGGEPILPVGRVAAPGSHNLVNACFAAALARLAGLANDAIVNGLSSFTGLPHRTQCVRQVHGVRFINDSKGTNVGATCTALEGMTAPTVLIAGGVGKDQDFQPLATALRQKGRALIVFGRDAERIASAVNRAVPTHTVGHLDEAVSLAQSLAQPGDTVLFSPACSSFDMFRNFEERGDAFVETVEALSA